MKGLAPQLAIRAPLSLEDAREKIGAAVWLYLELLSLSNDRGVALCRLDRLAADLQCSEEEVQGWLGVLHGAGLIEPTTPPPFLVIRLRFWSGEAANAAESAAAYSNSFQAIQRRESKSNSNSSKRVDEREALLQEILETVGESDPTQFRAVLDLYAPDVIRAVIGRVRMAGEIRKSKTALFRFLLSKQPKHHV